MTVTAPEYVRRPESMPGVDAIHYTDAVAGQRIVKWIDGLRGRGAAWVSDDGLILRVPAQEFDGRVVWVPLGWVVYKEFLSTHFHIAPQHLFEQMYEPRK